MRLLGANARVLAERCGRPLDVVAVSARNRSRDRGVDTGGLAWFDDPAALAREAAIDVFVELIGGSEGVAATACRAAFGAGRHVITANKAMVAHHGAVLSREAEAAGVALAYEAAVAGGIPIIKTLREGLVANRFDRVYGILNGTCNYILSAMRDSGRDFDDVLADAQALGYAEADPSFDVDGIDAAHKLSILASLAFGGVVDFRSVHIEGIRHVSLMDIRFAEELGYRIKLLAIAARAERGVEQRVHPCMVPLDALIAHVEGAFNAVVAHGDFMDTLMQVGPGAGGGPTASAVVSDLADLARGQALPAFTVPAALLSEPRPLPMADHEGAYYVRLMVVDRPGVFADVAGVLRDNDISMEAVLQRGHDPGETVPVVLTTHRAREAAMTRSIETITELGAVVEPPRLIRIEPF